MGNNKLIKYQGGLLKQVGNAISVTNKLLALTEPDLIPYRKGNNWGYCTYDKKIVIDCVYYKTEPFYNGLANIELNWKWGLIDKQGKVVIPCTYDNRIDSFSEGLANVRKNDKWGFINDKSEVIVPFLYNGASPFSEGLARVSINSKYGFIDRQNNLIIPFIYDNVHSFKDGLSSVRVGDKWGLIDKTGKTIILVEINSLEELDSLPGKTKETTYPEIIKKGNKHGITDKNGNLLGKLYDCIDSRGTGFSNDLIDVRINGKWGFINSDGSEIISCIYDEVCPFSEELAEVSLEGYWGYINTKGEEIIPFIYDSTFPFSNNLAMIQIKEKGNYREGYINKNGTEYWED